MEPLKLKLVGAIGIVALAVGALGAALLVRYGSGPLTVTPWTSLLFVLIGVWLLIGGRAVKKLKSREDTWVSPVGAARIAVLARACAYVMSGSCGFLAGVAIVSATRLWAPAMAHAALVGLVGSVTALFACVCAVLVERWCIDDGAEDNGGGDLGRAGKASPRPQA